MKYLGQVIYDQIARFRGGQLYISDNSDPGDYFSIVTGAAGATTISTVDGGVSNGTSADLTMNIDGEMATTVFNYWRLTSTGPIAEIDVTASYPQLKLTSTVNNNFNSGNIVFEKDRDDNSSVDNQELGSIYYYGRDASANNLEIFADIQGKISENTHGDEAGKIELNVMADGNGGVNTRAGVTVEGASDADIANVTLGYGATSTTTVSGGISIGGHTVNDIDIAGEFVDSDEHLMTSAAIDDRINAASGDGLSFDGSTANGLLTYKDADEITVESNATYDGTDLALTSGTSAKPELTIQNSNTDAVGSILKFEKTATGANNDKIGKIQFQADDNADSSITLAEIEGSMPSANATASAQTGQLQFQVRQAGSLANVLKANTIGFGTHLEFADGGLMPFITFKAAIVNFESATSTAPIFSIENQTDDANGPQLMLIKNRTTNPGSSDGDECGRITFRGYDSGNASTDYAEFYGSAVETDASNECGKAQLLVMADGQSTLRNAITGTGHTTVDKVDIDLGYGAASTTTIAGDLQVSGGDILGPTDGDLNIKSDGGVFFTLDTDTDESNQMFTIAETSSDATFEYNSTKGDLNIYSGSDTYPQINLVHRADNANGSSFTFTKQRLDSSTQVGEDNDVIGSTLYKSYNDNGTPEIITYAQTVAAIKDASDTDEAGQYTVQVATSDGSTSTLRSALLAEGSPSADDVDVTIGHGSTSVVTVPGRVSTNRIDIDSVGITAIQTSAESFADNDSSLMTSAAIDDRINAAGGGGSSLIHVDMPKYIAIYLFYAFNKDQWYTPPTYTTALTTSATIDGATLSAQMQARGANYIANSACKVKKVTLVFQMSTSSLSGDIDLEWALVKWTPQDDTANTAAMTEMTITNHDGAFTETDVHTLTFTVTDNAASTLAAKDCIAFCVRTTDQTTSSPRILFYGHGNFEIELT